MAPRPTGWNRFVARLQGEVPSAELEAFRRASGPVLELLEQVEHRRLECRIDGLDPWTVPPAMRTVFLCAWNAFVLQTLGNEYLDADYRAEPRTPHFVPPVTAAQVLRFYEPVEAWVNRAHQAQANPEYRLDVPVPALLPTWIPATPLSAAHLDGLLHAMRAVRDHADAAVAFLPGAPPQDPGRATQLNHIRQLYASAQARARYAEDLCGNDPVPQVRDRAHEHARAAVEQLYRLGQLIADPEMAHAGTAIRARIPPAPPRPPEAPAAPRPEASPCPAVAPPAAAPGPDGRRPAAAAKLSAAPVPPSTPAGRTGGGAAKAPRLHLVTRHDRIKLQTITSTSETVDFAGRLAGDVHVSLRLAYVRAPQGRLVVVRVAGWSYEAYPGLGGGSLTLHADGENAVLRPLPDSKRNSSHAREQVSYEEHLGYALPDGLLRKLCAARQVGLRFETERGRVDVDKAAVTRLKAYFRAFYDLVVQPVEFMEE